MKKLTRSNKKIRLVLYAIIIFLIISLLTFTTSGRVLIKTALLLPEIWPGMPVRPLLWISKEPVVKEIEVSANGRTVKADVYRPDYKKSYPTSIFVMMGINPRDKTVVEYAKSFTRVGFVVVVPIVGGFSEGRLNATQVDDLVSVFKFVRSQDFVKKDKLGFIGICAGGSYSLLAAQNKEIANDVKYVVTVSPYFDLYSSSFQILNKQRLENGKYQPWDPNPQVIGGLNEIFLSSLENEEEKDRLRMLLKGGSNISIKEEISKLSPEGQKIQSFLTNSNPELFRILWEQLPERTKEVTRSLSPKTKIGISRANVYILHDARDVFIPSSESEALKESAATKVYVKLDILEHSQLTRRLPRLKTFQEIAKLFGFTYRVLGEIS